MTSAGCGLPTLGAVPEPILPLVVAPMGMYARLYHEQFQAEAAALAEMGG